MKKMLRIASIVLAVVMLVACFAACGKDSDTAKVSLAAKTSTMSAELTEQYAKEYGFDVAYYEDSPTMYTAVINGTNAGCFEDRSVIGWAIQEEGLALKTVGEVENPAAYGFAVKKGTNAELLAMFNAGLANIKANGKYDAILAKYGYESTFADPTAERVESGVTPDKTYIIYSDNAFAPFEYLDTATNEYVGVDMDILAAVAEDQGFEYEMHNEGFDASMGAVQAGQADAMIAGMTITDARRETFDFSDGYFDDGQILVVPADSTATSVADLVK
ncbi:MAG: transporter substrate-binding domain-containing protein [Clostridia bacterium]|nr:transporter substrate-binding domain-containing protein [Clostridia bacterium]